MIEPFSLDIPFDYMVHGASNASPKRYATDPVGTMKSNLGGGSNLLELAKEKKSKTFIYILGRGVWGRGWLGFY